MTIAVHVTHEAVHKVGGIGAVLTGLITSGRYRTATDRTLLVGPLTDRHRDAPLGAEGTLVYDNWNGVYDAGVGPGLYAVEVRHGVRVVYGRRPFYGPHGDRVEAEVLLVDVEGAVPRFLNGFKRALYDHFGLASDRYEAHWEYEQYVRLAEPAYDAVLALIGDRGDQPLHVVAHEFMGLPTVLRALLSPEAGVFTVFYAHEVATARRLVEQLPGADAAFYGALRAAVGSGQTLEEVFGPQDDHYKHALVRQAWRCDAVLAVGDLVVDELRFLGPEFAGRRIDRVYNGLPVGPAIRPDEREASRQRLGAVLTQWLGWRPDLVLTHVSRLVASKGLWRDLMLLEALEPHLEAQGRTAALLVLACEAGPRLPASVAQMHADYRWPVVHREGYPDLTPGELHFDLEVRAFNARSRWAKVVFVNQFGFDAEHLGGAVSTPVSFADLRRGSDAELGLSIYEPFGIAQIEPLTHGAISVVSDTCGCLGFLHEVAGQAPDPPIYLCAGFSRAAEFEGDAAAWAGLDRDLRQQAERSCCAALAAALATALPHTVAGRASLLEAGYTAAAAMSWERVVETQYLPAVQGMQQRRG